MQGGLRRSGAPLPGCVLAGRGGDRWASQGDTGIPSVFLAGYFVRAGVGLEGRGGKRGSAGYIQRMRSWKGERRHKLGRTGSLGG